MTEYLNGGLAALLRDCVVTVDGELHGTGWYIAPSVVITSSHVVGDASVVRINGAAHQRSAIIAYDLDTDVTLIDCSARVSRWIPLAEHWSPGGRYLLRGNPKRDHTEDALVTLEGNRYSLGRSELKVADGQVKAGYSGSPVVSLDNGQAIGMVRSSRDVKNDLGGYVTPSSTIRKALERQGIWSPSPEMQHLWEDVAQAPGQTYRPTVTLLTPLPAPPVPMVGRAEVQAQIGDVSSPGTIRQLVGAPGSGKTAVLGWWVAELQADGKLDQDTGIAYIDMEGWTIGDDPFLRAFAAYLEIAHTSSGFLDLDQAERVSAVRLGIRRKLNFPVNVVAVDHADLALANKNGSRSLREILQGGLLGNAILIVSRWSGELPVSTAFRYRQDIHLAPLPAVDGGQFLSDESGLPLETCVDACTLVDADILQPGTLIAALPKMLEKEIEPYLLAEVLLSASFDHAEITVGQIWPVIASQGDWPGWVVLLAHAASGTCSCHPRVDLSKPLVQLLSGLGWVQVDAQGARPSSALVRLAPRLLALTISVIEPDKAEELDLLTSHLVSGARQGLLEELLTTVGTADIEGHKLQLIRMLVDEIARRSADEALGPALPSDMPARPAGVGWTAAEVLHTARTAATPEAFRASLYGADSLPAIAVDPADSAGIDLIRSALRELDVRYDHDSMLEEVRRDVFATFGITEDNLAENVNFYLMALDSCESSVILGKAAEVAGFIQVLAGLGTWMSDDWPIGLDLGHLEMVVGQAQILAMRSGFIGVNETLSMLSRIWERQSRQASSLREATLLWIAFVRAAASMGEPPELWLPITEWLLDIMEDLPDGPDYLSIASRVTALVRGVSEDFISHDERFRLINRAVKLLRHREDDLMFLAQSGDNRSLLALSRGLLALGRLRNLENHTGGAEGFTASGLRLLRRVVSDAPSAAAWLTYLQAAASADRTSLNEEVDQEYVANSEAGHIREALAQYRKWSRTRTIYSAREIAIDLWMLNAAWSQEGSLIGMAQAEDDRWIYKSTTHKLNRLEELYLGRRRLLDRRETAWGLRPELQEVKFRLEAQYQHIKSLYSHREPDHIAVLKELQVGDEVWGRLPQLELERARYLRYIWKTEESLDVFAAMENMTWGNRTLSRNYRIGYADALVLRARELRDEKTDISADYCHQALDLLGSLEESASLGAIVGLRARTELEGKVPSLLAGELADLFWKSGPYTRTWTQGSEIFDTCLELLIEEQAPFGLRLVASEFTNPRVLIEYAALLVRSFELQCGNELRDLGAALTALEGVRIMSTSQTLTPRLPFLRGQALLLACELSNDPNPFGWAARIKNSDIPDIELALRSFHNAAGRSIGQFRSLILQRSRHADGLKRRFGV
jgi:hypothetical protein